MLDADAVDKKKRVDDICDRCNSDTLGMKQAADLLEKEFADQGLLTHKVVDPKVTGFSPRIRDDYGGCRAFVVELIDHITTVGFCPKEMEHATFEQVKPGSTEIQTFNQNLAEDDAASAPVLPPIEYGSISCSHSWLLHALLLESHRERLSSRCFLHRHNLGTIVGHLCAVGLMI